mmetsp:Transcript_4590/g.13241  ORF Transcript_4590/g.13241 Transcript_4590/m.13241 type:complete len:94 (-) Transcript_4590:879-1160(-)
METDGVLSVSNFELVPTWAREPFGAHLERYLAHGGIPCRRRVLTCYITSVLGSVELGAARNCPQHVVVASSRMKHLLEPEDKMASDDSRVSFS